MRDDVLITGVLRKCEALKRAGLWCKEPAVRPAAWLNSFAADERPAAAAILDHFIYYSHAMTERLLRGAYRALTQGPLPRSTPPLSAAVLADVVFCAVEGEVPNPSDSGYAFCRMARQTLGVDEARLMSAEKALDAALRGTPVVFLDDFIGSGDQMEKMWHRPYRRTAPLSFAEAYAVSTFRAFYLTLAATTAGLTYIRDNAQGLVVVPVHVLDAQYRVTSIAYNQLTPAIPSLGQAIDNLLTKYAPQLDVEPYMDSVTFRKYGYHELGLMLAFEHSVPDATIPLLWANSSLVGWTPLVRRT